MLHLFHGENIELSRKELIALKESFLGGEIINLNGKIASITDIYQATQSDSLFNTKKLVIIENFFVKLGKKKSAIDKNIWKLIQQIPDNLDVVFWEEKKIPKIIINELPKKTDIALFEIDRLIFNLMDSIIANQTSLLLHKIENVIKNDSSELVFAMLVRQFRLLIMVKEMNKSIPDLSPWQISKLNKQAQYFESEKLLELYNEILNIDVRMKTSSGAFNLTDELKLFLIKI